MRHVPDSERRARLAIRHALAPETRAQRPEDAARAVVALHATDAPSVHLSAWARTESTTPAAIDRALYDDRSLVKQLAMRRTLFTFPRDLIPAVMSSAAARTAAIERTRMIRDVERAGLATDGAAWLAKARDDVEAALERSFGALSASQLRKAVAHIDTVVPGTSGEQWSAPRVLTLLGAQGVIVRGPCTGRFPTARPLWTLPSRWLGGPVPAMEAADGYRELVRRWLHAFGPGTEEDIVWWLGATKKTVRAALAELGAVEVSLDGPAPGWLLPDDLDVVPAPGPWTALLPPLDPTVMGWKHRGFYLGPHHRALFDGRGNAGTTAWAGGRVVGCWVQDSDASVRVHLLEPVSGGQRASLDAQAGLLTAWLDGARSPTGYRSPAMRGRPAAERSAGQDAPAPALPLPPPRS
ncbi:winged helix DNA-binding domain-containing protein [Streptomyces reniochalinae]|uniref:Winged helix DNA-binding domain-containing protein n=1 Tax=Streptomyces reniochalinae TaxID=2250578 RepID=A0A367F3G5_9ACTN|nr:winged helix DNA-binding domain-containing protein [Streptomyces reniochalinae]RCG24227.1 winged helix DNA-binding domain-containing protein [Streptomyces reniochalinae]